jgi:hypothetical protein
MRVHFHNSAGVKLYLAIMRFAPDACPGGQGQWLVEGWWTINPGGEVFAFETTNINSAYYAEDAEGLGKVWNGNYTSAYVPSEAFSHCFYVQPPGSRLVGMRQLNTGQLFDDFTLYINP